MGTLLMQKVEFTRVIYNGSDRIGRTFIHYCVCTFFRLNAAVCVDCGIRTCKFVLDKHSSKLQSKIGSQTI